MNTELPRFSLLISDDHPREVKRRLTNVEPILSAMGLVDGSWDRFRESLYDENAVPTGQTNWTVERGGGFVSGRWMAGPVTVAFTTDPDRVLPMARELRLLVAILDNLFFDQPLGEAHAKAILSDPRLSQESVVVFKTTRIPERTADLVRKKRTALQLRNPFFGEFGRYNLQLLSATDAEDLLAGDDEDPEPLNKDETERFQYALLALSEQEFARRARKIEKSEERRALLRYYEESLRFFGCFPADTSRASADYLQHLERQYTFGGVLSPDVSAVEFIPFREWLEAGMVEGETFVEESQVGAVRKELCGVEAVVAPRPEQLTEGIKGSETLLSNPKGLRIGEDGPMDLGMARLFDTQLLSHMRPKFKILQRGLQKFGSIRPGRDNALFRFLLRYGEMHALEGLLAYHPELDPGKNGGYVSKNAVQQIIKPAEFSKVLGGAPVASMVAAETAALFYDAMVPAARPCTRRVVKNGRDAEETFMGLKRERLDAISPAMAQLAPENERGPVSLEHLAGSLMALVAESGGTGSLLEILEELQQGLSRNVPYWRADQITQSLADLRRSLLTDVLVLQGDLGFMRERREGNAGPRRTDFAGKTTLLLDRERFHHHSVLARRFADSGNPVEALRRDPLCPKALLNLSELDEEAFVVRMEALRECVVETGFLKGSEVFAYETKTQRDPWVPLFPQKVNLFDQVLSGLYFLKRRVELFCCVLSWMLKEPAVKKKKRSATDFEPWADQDELMEAIRAVGALWKRRGWSRLFAPELPQLGAKESLDLGALFPDVNEKDAFADYIRNGFSTLSDTLDQGGELAEAGIRQLADVINQLKELQAKSGLPLDGLPDFDLADYELTAADFEAMVPRVHEALSEALGSPLLDPLQGAWARANLLERMRALAEEKEWDLTSVPTFEFAAPKPIEDRVRDGDNPVFALRQILRELPPWFRLGWLPPADLDWLFQLQPKILEKGRETDTQTIGVDDLENFGEDGEDEDEDFER